MSTTRESLDERFGVPTTPARTTRLLALLAAAGLILSFLNVLWEVTTIVGGRSDVLLVAAAALVAATVGARYLTARTALGVGGAAFGLGIVAYAMAMPQPLLESATLGILLADLFVLLTGNLKIIQIVAADTWAVAMAPAPVYLTWHLALRRRYDWASIVGGGSLAFLVLTGDASTISTLAGALSLLAMLGLGSFESFDADWEQVQDLGLLLLATVVLTRLVRLVPASGISEGPSAAGGPGQYPTLQGGLLSGGDRANILGGVRLSPTAQFEVQADRPALWHVAAYDRYTGRNWVQSGGTQSYRPENLGRPPGESQELLQTFETKTSVSTVPAAWRPTYFERAPRTDLRVTSEDGFRAKSALSEGQEYVVESQVPAWSEGRLRNAGTDYPGAIEERYRQVPDDLPARVRRKTNDITSDAGTPYDAAVAVTRWLKAAKGYSLTVSKPNGDVVDSFLFEMDRGYCVYFASTMTMMLRTQGIPARFVTGYTPGERIADKRWLIRGYHSHAWVDVFFPGVGWVPFDPTPGGARRTAQRERLEQARANGEAAVETSTPTPTPTDTPTPTPGETSTPADNATSPEGPAQPSQLVGQGEDPGNFTLTDTPEGPGTPGADIVAGGGGNVTPDTSSGGLVGEGASSVGGRDRLSMLAGAAGLALGAYRFRILQRGYEQFKLRWQPTGDDPRDDIVRAFDRLELLLSKEYRDRSESETPRMYLRALGEGGIDARAHRVGELYEQAYYGGDVTDEHAEEAVRLVDELVRDHGRLP